MATQTDSAKVRQIVTDLLVELGEDVTPENIEGFSSNHSLWLVDAADGDVEAIVALRTACGLPIIR